MNYGDIKSHFEALLNRSDITAALTTLFIDQGISRIERQLRAPINEIVATYTINNVQTASIAVPQDFLETISLYYDEYELQRLPMGEFRPYAQYPQGGKPNFYSRQQQNFLLHPQPSSGNIVLYYYGEFPDMTLNTDENQLAKTAPELIIYAALTFAADYYLDERRQLFEDRFNQILSDIQTQSDEQELTGGTQVILPSATYSDYQ